MSFLLPFQLTDFFAKLLGIPGGLAEAVTISTETLGLTPSDPTKLSANAKAALAAILGTAALGVTAVGIAARELSHTRITIDENPTSTTEKIERFLEHRQVKQLVAGIGLGAVLLGASLLPQTRIAAAEKEDQYYKINDIIITPSPILPIGGLPYQPPPYTPPTNGGGIRDPIPWQPPPYEPPTEPPPEPPPDVEP